jgi:hypothetical protein
MPQRSSNYWAWSRADRSRNRGTLPHPACRPRGIGAAFPGVEAQDSFLSSADVKNAWSSNSIVPYLFMACCFVVVDAFAFID